MEMPDSSSEFSSNQLASLVKKALDLAEFDHTSEEVLDEDDEDIETDQAEPAGGVLAHDHENPVRHFGQTRGTLNSQWHLVDNLITPDHVSEIEKELEFYEKIALVFLLYDSEDLALQRIKVAKQSSSIGLISDWAIAESITNSNWRDKFLEALCIIQNYKLIKKLGFSRDDVDLRFLPDNVQTSLYVDVIRKALYILCESLDREQSLQLLNHMKTKLMECGHVPKDFWAFDADLIEIALLQVMSLHLLNVGANCTDSDASSLVCGLKAVGATELAESFQSLCSRNSDVSLSTAREISSFISSVTSRSGDCKMEMPASSSVSEERFIYPINPDHVGLCVIINQKIFTRDKSPELQDCLPDEHLDTRVGTDLDRDRLYEIFTKLGFTIVVFENLTHVQLLDKVKKVANTYVQLYHSSFALCILSHGKRNAVYGSNSIPVNVEKIEYVLHKSDRLFGKPKILIIQACQGTARQKAVPCENIVADGPVCTRTAPEVGDMLIFWSTVPGFAAFRDKVHGSWFVKSLWTEMMTERAQMDLTKCFTRVIGRVSDRQANLDGELKAMMPTYNTTLRRDLIFARHTQFYIDTARKMVERVMFYKLIYEFADYQLPKRRR